MLIILVLYLTAGFVMWFVAYMVAPVGYTLPFSRAAFTVLLMARIEKAADWYLPPIVGEWGILAELAAPAAVGMIMLRLPFWRSLLAVLAYTIIFVAGTMAVSYYIAPQKRANNRLHTNAAVALCFQAETQWRGVGEPRC